MLRHTAASGGPGQSLVYHSNSNLNSNSKTGAETLRLRPVSIVHPEHPVNVARRRAAAEGPGAVFADQFENLANMHAHVKTGTLQISVSYTCTIALQRARVRSSLLWDVGALFDFAAHRVHSQPPHLPHAPHVYKHIHTRCAGEEIWAQTRGTVHAFVSGAGTGGTIAGVSAALKRHDPGVKVYLIDPPGSSLYNKVSGGACRCCTVVVQRTVAAASFHAASRQHPFDTNHRLAYPKNTLRSRVACCIRARRQRAPGCATPLTQSQRASASTA